LKACFARRVRRYDFPDKDGAGKVFTHKLRELIKIVKLTEELSEAEHHNLRFSAGWSLVCKWNEESRYSSWTRGEAEAIIDAIARRKDGVLPWIKRYW
jgi:hypothetical protein